MSVKRFETDSENFQAWVERPEVWLAGHYNAYMQAVDEARQQRPEYGLMLCRLVGCIALIQAGVITCEIPGLVVEADVVDVESIDARGMAFLLTVVSIPLEGTALVPFHLADVSGNGTGKKATANQAP